MDILSQLASQPALRAWAIASVLIGLKTIAVGMYVSSIRLRKNIYISPEDYAYQGGTPATGSDPDVERARRMHQNDLESGLPFALIGLAYAFSAPTTLGLWLCYGGYVVARILHSIFYARAMMPHRSIAFGLGFLALLWMALASLLSFL